MNTICDKVKEMKDELAIDRFEDKYELDLDGSFKEFFQYNNGGTPRKKNFEIGNDEYEVRCFLSFNDDEYNSIRKPLESFQEETHGKIFPFAKDSGDNYYCLNVETGAVYFWSVDDEKYYKLTESFTEFVDLLK